MTSARILIVEDEESLTTLLRYNLEAEGFAVDVAIRGDEADLRLHEMTPDLVLLDWMVPGLSGIELCRRIRARRETERLPVIMLTARGEEADRVRGLSTGADDYVVKPCDTGELHARIRAVLRRRAPQQGDEILQVNGLRLDPLTLGVTAHTETGPRAIALSPLEFRLLHFLVAHPQRVHSRTQLLDRVWGNHVFVGERTVDVHVRKLRVALAGTPCDGLIQTVRGGGYRLVVGGGAAQAAEPIGDRLNMTTSRKPEPLVDTPFARTPLRPAAMQMTA